MLSKIITQKLQKLETIEQRIKTEQSTKTQLRNSTERVINKNKAISKDTAIGKEKPAKLTCRKVRGSYQYLINTHYASKILEINAIKELAIKEYHKALLPLIKKEIKYLKLLLKTEEQIKNAYNGMYEGKRILFEPDLIPTSKIIEDFENTTYEGLSFDDNDQTEYYTNRGERVRSKSEKIIADELARQKIPYKYEKPLVLFVDGKQKQFFPDFTVLNKTTGKIIYLEHLGMMDNSYYYNNTLNKLDIYEKNGLLIGKDILIFHESSRQPLNTRTIDDYINEFLL